MSDHRVRAGPPEELRGGREDRGARPLAALEDDEPEEAPEVRLELLCQELHGQPALVAVVGIGEPEDGRAMFDSPVAKEVEDMGDGLLAQPLEDACRAGDRPLDRVEPFDLAGLDSIGQRSLEYREARAARRGDREDA
jgi:hypothetical protein